MSKFKVGDNIIANDLSWTPLTRKIVDIYKGEKVLNGFITLEFYQFEDGSYAVMEDIDNYFHLSLKSKLKKL